MTRYFDDVDLFPAAFVITARATRVAVPTSYNRRQCAISRVQTRKVQTSNVTHRALHAITSRARSASNDVVKRCICVVFLNYELILCGRRSRSFVGHTDSVTHSTLRTHLNPEDERFEVVIDRWQ